MLAQAITITDPGASLPDIKNAVKMVTVGPNEDPKFPVSPPPPQTYFVRGSRSEGPLTAIQKLVSPCLDQDGPSATTPLQFRYLADEAKALGQVQQEPYSQPYSPPHGTPMPHRPARFSARQE